MAKSIENIWIPKVLGYFLKQISMKSLNNRKYSTFFFFKQSRKPIEINSMPHGICYSDQNFFPRIFIATETILQPQSMFFCAVVVALLNTFFVTFSSFKSGI